VIPVNGSIAVIFIKAFGVTGTIGTKFRQIAKGLAFRFYVLRRADGIHHFGHYFYIGIRHNKLAS